MKQVTPFGVGPGILDALNKLGIQKQVTITVRRIRFDQRSLALWAISKHDGLHSASVGE